MLEVSHAAASSSSTSPPPLPLPLDTAASRFHPHPLPDGRQYGTVVRAGRAPLLQRQLRKLDVVRISEANQSTGSIDQPKHSISTDQELSDEPEPPWKVGKFAILY